MALQVMSCTTAGGAICVDYDVNSEPGVVHCDGPWLRFGKRAMAYKVHSWAYPGCQRILSL